ncbi:MAG: 30S ribosomal protein S1 [Candidatus Cloacimonadota bacterium]|nr:MAG: 30S ribosomal protein S1 [Candidatus Cloacimonadota bacterium]
MPDKRTSKSKKTNKSTEVKSTAIFDIPQLSRSEMEELYNGHLIDIKNRGIVKGKIIKLTSKDAIIDLGLKSEGCIPLSDFSDSEEVNVGDDVEVFLEDIEDDDGFAVISKQKADFMKVWDLIYEKQVSQEPVTGEIIRRVKGGMIVNVSGAEAFLPGSQIDFHPVSNLDGLIGQEIKVKVIKLNRKRRNIVVSRRVILEEEKEKAKQKLLAELEEGQEKEGIVKNITDFGVFVDLGGIDGLLHITDMSWGRISHPSELVAIGDKIKVKVIAYDSDKQRVSLGMKQLYPYPWEDVQEKYPVEKKVRGKIVSIAEYGAFVELEKGVEGLIHISEMSWTKHIKHPSQLLAIGDVVEAVVLDVDKERERISLGLKQLEPDPWKAIEEKYPVETKITGKVRTLTNFGAFVEIENGIDGLIHISDFSWTERVKHPKHFIEKGQKVECIVLEIDPRRRRISLGIKQLMKDPFETLAKNIEPGAIVKGKLIEIVEKGLIVELNNKIRGFVPLAHSHKEDFDKSGKKCSLGEVIDLKIIDINTKTRRIILSEKDAKKELLRLDYKDYLKTEKEDIIKGEEPQEQTDTATEKETEEQTDTATEKETEEQTDTATEKETEEQTDTATEENDKEQIEPEEKETKTEDETSEQPESDK